MLFTAVHRLLQCMLCNGIDHFRCDGSQQGQVSARHEAPEVVPHTACLLHVM